VVQKGINAAATRNVHADLQLEVANVPERRKRAEVQRTLNPEAKIGSK